MRIKTTRAINARTQDGRGLAADEDAVVDLDDDDAGMVGLAKSLILSGQAVHYGDAGAVDETEPDAVPEDEVVPPEDDSDEDADLDDEDDED